MKNKFHRKVVYRGLIVLIKCAQVFPRRALLRFAAWSGKGAYRVLAKERAKTLRNLARVYGAEKTPAEIAAIGQTVFVNLAKTLVDWIYLDRMRPEELRRLVDVEGKEKLDAVLSRGKGCIVFTAHIGNWEYLAAYMTQFLKRSGVIARKARVSDYDRLLVDMRRKHNVETIFSTGSPKRILQLLKENCCVGILPDQDIDSISGVFVDFLGEPAYTPAGPAALARASGAGLIPAFPIRQPDDRYRIYIEDEITLTDSGDKQSDLVENTQKMSRVLERYIRAHPEQWVWMHNRWKTKQKK
jgi:KDO2-lipid IV(A) lauroyltransferase